MKTVEIQLFKFAELSDEAKQVAISWYRDTISNDDFWGAERHESFEAAKVIFDSLENIGGEIKGARLYTWLQNNVISNFDKPVYFSKHEGNIFKRSYFAYKYDKPVKFRRSRIETVNTLKDCPLTGVCYDYDFLQPIIDFMDKPDKFTTNEDLTLTDSDYERVSERDYEAQYEESNVIENIEANDYDFTEDGKIY